MIDLNSFQSINFSQFFNSVKFRSGSGYHLVIDFCIVLFYMLMILEWYWWNLVLFRKLFSEFFFRITIKILTSIRVSLWNSLEKVILYILKISTKFAPQSVCENQNSVQDQDQDHDFTLDFNIRPTFYT